MLGTLIVNGTTGFIMVVTFAFCLPERLIAGTPSYFFAYIDTFYYATGSKAGASVMTALITLLVFCSTISAVATSSRQMFAFARDRGLPFSSFLCRVSPEDIWNISFGI
jgi:amino acid transporter